MSVYRLISALFPRCDGEGARLYGGRWKSRGRAVVYDGYAIPGGSRDPGARRALGDDYVVAQIGVPDEITIEEVPGGQLTDWEPATTRAMGDQWVEKRSTAVLKVPSTVIPAEAI